MKTLIIKIFVISVLLGFATTAIKAQVANDSVKALIIKDSQKPMVVNDTLNTEDDFFDDALPQYEVDSVMQDLVVNEDSLAEVYRQMTAEEFDDDYFSKFNPTPSKAVWYAALFPGGGQIYNRKYWKLPIIYGGFLGLIYGYHWNNKYYRTYANAYRDLVLDSPAASYMDFLPPGYNVESRRDYLEKTFKRKKNSYRTYRDYCVVGMLGVYLVAMVDAYVDAVLYHFDVSSDLDANNKPALMLSYKINF